MANVPDTSATRHTRLLIGGLVIAVVALALALVLALWPGGIGNAFTGLFGTARYDTATDIVDKLVDRKLVKADFCAPENGNPPATSQARCRRDGDKDVVAMVFADQQGVESRIAKWRSIGGGTLLRGPNWLVNVESLDQAGQEAVRDALGGELVTVPG